MQEDRHPTQTHIGSLSKLARWTGLEPATPGVTGRYSNQLSYHRARFRRPERQEGLARWTGLEPATPGVTGRYSNQLSYHRKPHPAFRTCRRLTQGPW
jgi:hypothetical protein